MKKNKSNFNIRQVLDIIIVLHFTQLILLLGDYIYDTNIHYNVFYKHKEFQFFIIAFNFVMMLIAPVYGCIRLLQKMYSVITFMAILIGPLYFYIIILSLKQ